MRPRHAIAIGGAMATIALATARTERFTAAMGGHVEPGRSLAGAYVRGELVVNGDPGGMLGLHVEALDLASSGHVPLWSHSVGMGRPLYPADPYSAGVFDPILRLSGALHGRDFNRGLALGGLIYLVLTVLAFARATAHVVASPAALAAGAAAYVSVSPWSIYPNQPLFMHSTLLIALMLGLLLRAPRPSLGAPGDLPRCALVLGLLLASSSAALLPYLLLSGAVLVARRGEGRLALVRLSLALGAAACLGAMHYAPLRVAQGQSTNPLVPYLGFGMSLSGLLRSSSLVAPWWVWLSVIAVPAALARSSPARWAQVRSRWASLLLLSAFCSLGLAGGFDGLMLAAGLNVQLTNVFVPVLAACFAVLLAMSVDTLLLGIIGGSPSRARPIGAVALAAVGLLSQTGTPRPFIRADQGVLLIRTPLEGLRGAFAAAIPELHGDPLQRMLSLHAARPEDPRRPVGLTSRNVNSFLVYPLQAPLFGLVEASGGSSLTPAGTSELFDMINCGAIWSSPRHPAAPLLNEHRAAMSDGAVGHAGSAYGEMAQQKRNNLLVWNLGSPLLKYTSAAWVVADRPVQGLRAVRTFELPTWGRELELRRWVPRFVLHEVTGALPKCWFPDEVEGVATFDDAAWLALEARSADRAVALVEAPPETGTLEPAAGTVLRYAEVVNGIEVELLIRRGGLVVLSSTWFPGWTASVDQEPARVHRVNRALMGVEVEAGRRRLVLRYVPEGLGRGACVSLAGALVLLLLWRSAPRGGAC